MKKLSDVPGIPAPPQLGKSAAASVPSDYWLKYIAKPELDLPDVPAVEPEPEAGVSRLPAALKGMAGGAGIAGAGYGLSKLPLGSVDVGRAVSRLNKALAKGKRKGVEELGKVPRILGQRGSRFRKALEADVAGLAPTAKTRTADLLKSLFRRKLQPPGKGLFRGQPATELLRRAQSKAQRQLGGAERGIARRLVGLLRKQAPGKLRIGGELLRRLGSKLGRKGTIGLMAGLPLAGLTAGALMGGKKEESE